MSITDDNADRTRAGSATDPKVLHIGPARAAEYPQLGELIVAAYQPSGLPRTDPYYQQLAATADRAAQSLVLAARYDQVPVRTVSWCFGQSRLREIARPGEGEIRMLAVDPAYQRLGIGRALVQSCIQLSLTAGDTALVLSSARWMSAAHRLYESLGFVRVPKRDWQPRTDVDLLVYQLLLATQ